MFKFYLNGTEVIDHPEGWNNIDTTVKRDVFSGGLFFDANIKLVTYGGQDLYSSLQSLWNADPFGVSSFDIFQRSGTAGYVLIHAGIVFHSDLKFNLVNNNIEFKVDDNGWYSKLKNNQRLDVNMGTSLSKNQIAIQPISHFDLSFHRVSNGTYYAQTRDAYKVYDCLKFLVDFMSDGEIQFESDCFNVGGIYEYYCIVNGHELWAHDHTQSPRLNFGLLFGDLKKRLNVRFAIVNNGATPTIKIEPADYFYDTSTAFTLPDTPDEISIQADSSIMYSAIVVGSEKYETTSSMTFPDIQNLIAFRQESLHFEGVNNIDNELDLVGKLVVSNSSIDLCLQLLSGYDSYDEDNFMVQYTGLNQTHKSDWAGTGHYLYNEQLNNINTLQRWANYIPGNVIANFNNTTTGRMLAFNTVLRTGSNIGSASTIGPIQFDDDYTHGFDPNGVYGGSTAQGSPVSQVLSIYTAPSNANLTFSSQVSMDTIVTGGTIPSVQIFFQKFNASNTVIDDFSGPLVQMNVFSGQQGPTVISASWNTYLNTSEYIAVYVKCNTGGFFYNIRPNDTFLSCNGINTGGGTVLASNSGVFKCYKVNFNYPITLADFQTIGNSKNGLISIPLHNNRSIQGWVDNIKFDNSSGETTFTLISDGNTVYR